MRNAMTFRMSYPHRVCLLLSDEQIQQLERLRKRLPRPTWGPLPTRSALLRKVIHEGLQFLDKHAEELAAQAP